ncbi:MAG TPA: M23 family metallopeptidase [Hyphomonadaceae bacterium]|jgi:murein DD-endopeptidase MepM/ murein hydrolase activator NlpD
MIKTVLTLAFAGTTGLAGYIGGSIYPAPPALTNAIYQQASDIRARVQLETASIPEIRRLIPADKFDELRQDISNLSAAAGEVIVVEQNTGSLEEQLDNLAIDSAGVIAAPAPAGSAVAPAAPGAKSGHAAATAFEPALELCPRMTVQNAPAADAQLRVRSYAPVVVVNGVKIATYPSRGACLSSGFGQRNSRLHKGLDYHSESGAPILAAGDGKVVEMKYRDDYGNMIVIDHGGGVHTRYAHLASFGRGLMTGATVRAGDQIGLMGNTAGYAIPMHLHYELLLGDYSNPKASFGLQPANPLSYPAAP